MFEDTPEYPDTNRPSDVLDVLRDLPPNDDELRGDRRRIELFLWPPLSDGAGLKWIPAHAKLCPNPTYLNLEICDAELLVREWGSMPNLFNRTAAETVKLALREREYAILAEDCEPIEETKGDVDYEVPKD
jgi:hypothetical protein